jgi:hypothetical protein
MLVFPTFSGPYIDTNIQKLRMNTIDKLLVSFFFTTTSCLYYIEIFYIFKNIHFVKLKQIILIRLMGIRVF